MIRNTKPHANTRASRRRRRAYFRGKLLERRRDLLERLMRDLESRTSTSGRMSGDFADMAATSFEQEIFFRIGTAESDVVAEIDHALLRIEDGTYGICEECGKTIPQNRLRALPFASLCVRCKKMRELEEAADAEPGIGFDGLGAYGGVNSADIESTLDSVRTRRAGN